MLAGPGRSTLATTIAVGVVPGFIGTGMRFSENNSYFELSDEPRFNPDTVTVTAWVQAEKIAESAIVDKHEWDGDNKPKGYVLRLAKGVPQFAIGDGVNWNAVTAKSEVTLKKWVHIAGVFDGSELRLYLNGEEAGKVKNTNPIRASKWPLRIGNGSFDSASKRPFVGVIDEVYIFGRPLAPDEIKTMAKQSPLE